VKNILKLLGSVLMLFGALLALPSSAATQSNNKTFQLDLSVITQGSPGGLSQLKAVVSNTSPSQSTANFSSIDLFVDLGWTIVRNDSAHPVTVFESNAPNVKYPANTSQPGHIKVMNLAPVKPIAITGNTLVITFWVTGSSGDGTWNANPNSGSQLNGNVFTRTGGQNIASVASASLACGGNQSFSIAPGTILATRGMWNKDGTVSGDPCAAVNYYASNTLGNNVGLPPNIVHFRWDQSGANQTFSTAAFDYKIYYSTAPTTTRVGWLRQNGSLAVDPGANPSADNNPVVFIDAPACLTVANQVPTPYGTLTQAMLSSDDVLFIDTLGATLSPPAVVPAEGFSIYVGLERMQVTGYNEDGSWNVVRGQLGTTADDHDVDALVMSTPLPALATQPAAYLSANGTFVTAPVNPYLANTQAQVCLAETGTSGGFPFIRLIDIGDGWVKIN